VKTLVISLGVLAVGAYLWDTVGLNAINNLPNQSSDPNSIAVSLNEYCVQCVTGVQDEWWLLGGLALLVIGIAAL
jgi:hypothetical protein